MDKDEKIVACSDMPADVEMGSGSTEVISPNGLKRELGSRHINMIAVAGMIVSFSVSLSLT
jgi:amino acid transporter